MTTATFTIIKRYGRRLVVIGAAEMPTDKIFRREALRAWLMDQGIQIPDMRRYKTVPVV